MKICIKKLINIIFFTIASPSSILAMQKDISQKDEMFQSFKDIITEHEADYKRQKQEAVCTNLLIENIIADLLECKKKFPLIRSEISNLIIADLLLKLASPQSLDLNISPSNWENFLFYIPENFPPPLGDDVYEILKMVKDTIS